MASEAYEILALLMRYVFAFIGLLIVWRSFRWLRRDARAYRREMRSLPDAGLIGEMVNLVTGESQPLPHEGVIGSARSCDIRVKGEKVQRNHARFEFEEGKGLKILPLRHSDVYLGGEPVRGFGYALHGTQLQIGGNVLRVRLFAGLKVPYRAAYPVSDANWSAETWPPDYGQYPEGAQPAYQQPVPNAQPDLFPAGASPVPQNLPPCESAPQAMGYDGHYTDDGQMTWKYAYSLEELNAMMQSRQMEAVQDDSSGEEAVPYVSPIPRRRRRQRHE